MGQGVRTGLGHGGITCVLQTQFSRFSFFFFFFFFCVCVCGGGGGGGEGGHSPLFCSKFLLKFSGIII